MPKITFSPDAVPSFDASPSVVLIVGDLDFFVEEDAGKAAEKLAAEGAEILRFEDDAPAEALSDALLNRSLFSPQRVVRFDITRLLGTETPGRLVEKAVEAWEKGSPAAKREAYRHVRALLSALDLTAAGAPEEVAETAAKKSRKKEFAGPLAEILREMPEERGNPAALSDAIRLMLDRGNDGTVALLTAAAPPAGVDLVAEISRKGLVLESSIDEKNQAGALARLAHARAKERDIAIDGDAIARLGFATDQHPEQFAAELDKLLAWAGPGGRIRAADVKENVDDESSEDLYAFYESVGRRDAGDALARLDRLFSGRAVRAGGRDVDTEEYWPVRFFGMFVEEVRRMLLIRSRLEEKGSPPDPSLTLAAFQARIGPLLAEPVVPFGFSPFVSSKGIFSAYPWFMASKRAARFTTRELAAGLARAADVDVKLKTSAEPLETLSVYLGELIAGK